MDILFINFKSSKDLSRASVRDTLKLVSNRISEYHIYPENNGGGREGIDYCNTLYIEDPKRHEEGPEKEFEQNFFLIVDQWKDQEFWHYHIVEPGIKNFVPFTARVIVVEGLGEKLQDYLDCWCEVDPWATVIKKK